MLTDIAVRKAKGKDRPYKMGDTGGLFLLVAPSGVRGWRFKYRFGGLEKGLSFGVYPEVSLGQARSRRDEARAQLRDGLDPSAERRRKLEPVVAVPTFEAVAREWHALQLPKWNPNNAAHILAELVNDVFPDLGRRAITDINAPLVLSTLRKVEARGAIDTARRLRQRMSAIFVYGIATTVCIEDPAAIIAKAMAPMKVAEKRPAITALDAARAVLAACDASNGLPATKLAMRLLALTATRPGEVVGAAWGEFTDLEGDAPTWRIPKERMKGELGTQQEHVVPLSSQAVATIEALKALATSKLLVFPNRHDPKRSMTGDALNAMLIRSGFRGKHVPHGWRSTFSTNMNELAEREGRASDRAIIDLMLAHVQRDGVEKAYNRSAYMPRRREIAQAWADKLMDGALAPQDLVIHKTKAA